MPTSAHAIIKRVQRLVVLTGLLLCGFAFAQQPPEPPPVPENPATGQGGRLPVRILGDQFLVKAVMQNSQGYREVHLLLDFGVDKAFDLHAAVYQRLMGQFGEDETTLKIIADGFHMEIHRDAITESADGRMNDLNDRYETEMEDIAVTAVLGVPTLKAFSFAFDPQQQELFLTPAGDADADELARSHDAMIRGLEFSNGQVTLPGTYADGRETRLQFGVSGYHTYINQETASALGHPHGDVDGIYLGHPANGVPISGMTAFYPQPFEGEQAGLLMRTGINLWQAYRFEINLKQGFLALTRLEDNRWSEADFAFYSAAADRDRLALWNYVETYPDDRNIEESSRLLFELGLEQGASVEEQMKALQTGLGVTKDSRKASFVASFLFPLYADEDNRSANAALLIALGVEGQKYIARSKNPAQRQDMQMMMGELHLSRGEAREAWKYYLAAAFNGDPQKEMPTRLGLARAYEAMGRHRRAYSNFRRVWDALPNPEDPPQGLIDFKAELRAEMDAVAVNMEADDPLLIKEG